MKQDGFPFVSDGPSTSQREYVIPRLKSILIVDDEPEMRSFLRRGLEKQFSLVELAEDVASAELLRQRCHFDLIIANICLPGKTGVEWIKELREQGSSTSVIFITAHADMETAIDALRAGATDLIAKPFRMEQILAALERCMEPQQVQSVGSVLKCPDDPLYDHAGLIGQCDEFQRVRDLIRQVAPMPSTVLIQGESGTGKELAAKEIHELSGRSGCLVPINCAAISAELLESELFGHVKGAFTGAHQARQGLFHYASGGTLFLDEIGEMPLSMQAHLLRVLEERRIRAVGANQETQVDVRVIAATNRNLLQEVEQGRFREDLYFRLLVLAIRMPPLRERKQDLPLLVRHFAEILAANLGVPVPQIEEAESLRLMEYDWPGNVRELKNVMERALLLNKPPAQCLRALSGSGQTAGRDVEEGEALLLETVEKRHILRVLKMEGGNKSAAARHLGISRKTLERKVQAWADNPVSL